MARSDVRLLVIGGALMAAAGCATSEPWEVPREAPGYLADAGAGVRAPGVAVAARDDQIIER